MSYTYIQSPLAVLNSQGHTEASSEVEATAEQRSLPSGQAIEHCFDVTFTTALALREKQIQQSYRPIIGVHKWFARRPGTVFRSLLLSEFANRPLTDAYWHGHSLSGVIADPFMGGGTTMYEAIRLGFAVVGTDINPMAYWVVRQSLAQLDLDAFASEANAAALDVEHEIGAFYRTRCLDCGRSAPVKYFLWVKVEPCSHCGMENDLFPGYLLAEAVRHPKHVVVCGMCGDLNEFSEQPRCVHPAVCRACGNPVFVEGPARKGRVCCHTCNTEYPIPTKSSTAAPRHRMWAIEYHCPDCKSSHAGRFFKQPDSDDLKRYEDAQALLARTLDLPIPEDEIPAGDETDRLLRWGYRHYREMFNDRQLVGLGLLLKRLRTVPNAETRHALLTVFSDFLRYQNMLCRYDTYALKCQDIFSVHGFPVGLVQCENTILGIPRVGSGSFRHFVEKYRKAKEYCAAPFETLHDGRRKRVIPIRGERIEAEFRNECPPSGEREACLLAASAVEVQLPPASLDGVFTDPPYFDNVQYAELMDFCFAWLRLGLKDDFVMFQRTTTRTASELTGNATLGRGLAHFTAGLSAVFRHYANALKLGAPFVFTYHHNDLTAYMPLVVAILDAGLECTATLPVAAEMGASLHIAGTGSSIVDSVFVCRANATWQASHDIESALAADADALREGGLSVTQGDLRCLFAGHSARIAVNSLRRNWDRELPVETRMTIADDFLQRLKGKLQPDHLVDRLLTQQSGQLA